ncbi:MAG: ribosome recycling factor [Chloroflexi bacterium]|jgi:ribosome recycling factor|nr:MAG: ribosome recycling factor [Chloroflexota bacterium]
MAIENVLDECRDRMGKSLDALKKEFNGIRTGRANPGLIESINVNYYDVATPLNQLATITVPESRVLQIQVWDPTVMRDVEKAIMTSDLGLTPSNDGELIRIILPSLTQERRLDLVKTVSKKTEEGHVSVRNIRRNAVDTLRHLVSDGELGKDDSFRAQNDIQTITDEYIANMNECRSTKELEVLEI